MTHNKYTYKQTIELSEEFLKRLENQEGKDFFSIRAFSKAKVIPLCRVRLWKKRYDIIQSFQSTHKEELCIVSNLTYGVSEEVWNQWLVAVDAIVDEIEGMTLSNDILRKLEEAAAVANGRLPEGKKVTQDMVDGTLAYFVEKTRENSEVN